MDIASGSIEEYQDKFIAKGPFKKRELTLRRLLLQLLEDSLRKREFWAFTLVVEGLRCMDKIHEFRL